jgi:hypothetical protein
MSLEATRRLLDEPKGLLAVNTSAVAIIRAPEMLATVLCTTRCAMAPCAGSGRSRRVGVGVGDTDGVFALEEYMRAEGLLGRDEALVSAEATNAGRIRVEKLGNFCLLGTTLY